MIDRKLIKTKADLIALSKAYKAENGCNASNEVLKELYAVEEVELKTFKGWKDAGYMVKKGSKAYTFWTAPKAGKKKDAEGKEIKVKKADGTEEDDKYKFFGICKLFAEEDVERIIAE